MVRSFQDRADGLPAATRTVCVRRRAPALLDTVRFLPDSPAWVRGPGRRIHSSGFFAHFSIARGSHYRIGQLGPTLA